MKSAHARTYLFRNRRSPTDSEKETKPTRLYTCIASLSVVYIYPPPPKIPSSQAKQSKSKKTIKGPCSAQLRKYYILSKSGREKDMASSPLEFEDLSQTCRRDRFCQLCVRAFCSHCCPHHHRGPSHAVIPVDIDAAGPPVFSTTFKLDRKSVV